MSAAAGGGEEWAVCGVRVRAAALDDAAHDALVLVLAPDAGVEPPPALRAAVAAAAELDRALLTSAEVSVVPFAAAAGGRLVLAGAGALSAYEDVRALGEAARRGVLRALAAGAARPALALPRGDPADPRWARAPLVALLAALDALYTPLQTREAGAAPAAEALGVCGAGAGGAAPAAAADLAALLREAVALETARVLCRDIGGADPERMTPRAAAEHVRAAFPAGGAVRVRVLDDAAAIRARYPLFAAVSRAADAVPRHRGCIVFLEYEPADFERTIMLVGKGVTYDTGGCDIKTGGAMAGMSRDKCGAAAVAGFFKACELLAPRIKAVGALALVRNSVGEEAYVADELLRSRGGLSVRVGNTDAEGRLAMADLLAEMAERAPAERAPHLFTVATLTGHAALALGAYSAALDNVAARAAGAAERLRAAGDALGEPLEVSRLRREDLAAHRGRAGDDLLQAEARPSAATPRGHQAPAAFLLLAARLHARAAPPYTHLDVAGAAGAPPAPPTAAPLLALAAFCGLLAAPKSG